MHDKKLQNTLQNVIDVLPEPLPALPPISPLVSSFDNHQSLLASGLTRMPGAIDTPTNSFGVFRRYHGDRLPTHDPERDVNLAMLSNIPQINQATNLTAEVYHPYPNRSSFLLGDWYWNGGPQKSQANFDSLVSIIGNDEFSPSDIKNTPWRQINTQLSINDWDKGEWQDEDAGWKRSCITIKVPFHHLTENPGIQDFTVEDFYHKSLVSIIQERIRNDARDNSHFHFEPFELLWNPERLGDLSTAPIRLQGELYTSPAFIATHQELQLATGEPDCCLPRVVVGLMFWSDATHLTNFGSAKLWPLYLLFGNDSKYQRCKPSRNLCEHAAYFEHVRLGLSTKHGI